MKGNYHLKIKKKMFYCFLSLVCIIGLCACFTDGKCQLSDNEMSNVYGGCGPCYNNGDKCRGESGEACGSRTQEQCSGYYTQGCRQQSRKCQNLTGVCNGPYIKDCDGSYSYCKCNWNSSTDECIPTVLNTWYCKDYTYGTKPWCEP